MSGSCDGLEGGVRAGRISRLGEDRSPPTSNREEEGGKRLASTRAGLNISIYQWNLNRCPNYVEQSKLLGALMNA